ncbi:class I adenylate-forming enzyme family protein [Herbaspirillum sp. RTI4]|uniref:class I adenylate-forming enzyme family protein n=1 Tax=Herbaspirillum sp. RTI4 TaxID=3048640 RepID=UPI002AB5714B|nr:class I adenylate-forming enzyme family protein [Herbaspirillum sp. RTI4]MDY7579125.1 class I adenylate-forming enzyme family protein [Herbaspirillum sp. RTI4]MEA9981296.1 class I adenylate-forming enzyme family protein [Herbaspirillum sp. RTI4]
MQNILTLHSPQLARDHYLSGVWQNETLYSLARSHAQERPTACALRDVHTRLTWRELVDWANSVSQVLHDAGLRSGDRVATWLPSCVEALVVFLACSRNGYICTPSLHQNHTTEEIMVLLRRVQCKALFAMPGYGADAERHSIFDVAGTLPSMKKLFALSPADTDTDALPAPVGSSPFPDRTAPVVLSPPDLNPDKITYLAFTSGTTGMPKGVMHSDNTLLANGRAIAGDWRHGSDTVILSLSPMSHHIGTVAFEQMLVIGCELVLHHAAAGKSALDWIRETNATYVMGVPTHAIDLLAALRQRGMSSLGQVKTFYMAGTLIPREIAEQFLKLGMTPQNIYGMTENGSHQYPLPTDSIDTIVSTCGRACRGYEVRLFKQENPDVEVEPGEIGEIGGRGGLLMLGYFDNQAATENSFNANGWFMSGDLGQFDSMGALRIVGRKKDLIIRGGHNIYPAKIEDLALRHPGVLKVAAYPIAHERLGEQVCMAIIARPGVQVEAHDIVQHLRDAGLSKYDMPEYFLCMDEFPMTASGKILKRDLVELTRTGKIIPTPINKVNAKKTEKTGAETTALAKEEKTV